MARFVEVACAWLGWIAAICFVFVFIPIAEQLTGRAIIDPMPGHENDDLVLAALSLVFCGLGFYGSARLRGSRQAKAREHADELARNPARLTDDDLFRR